jgi:hypothetical protein
MYACIYETGGGFFEGVCALSDQACISSDPPSPAIRGSLHGSTVSVNQVSASTAANLYSLLPYLVLAIRGSANR